MKTLKNIELSDGYIIRMGDQDIIQEVAKEWIEELENGELYPSEEIKMGNQIIIDWIKHFFNLEGEE